MMTPKRVVWEPKSDACGPRCFGDEHTAIERFGKNCWTWAPVGESSLIPMTGGTSEDGGPFRRSPQVSIEFWDLRQTRLFCIGVNPSLAVSFGCHGNWELNIIAVRAFFFSNLCPRPKPLIHGADLSSRHLSFV